MAGPAVVVSLARHATDLGGLAVAASQDGDDVGPGDHPAEVAVSLDQQGPRGPDGDALGPGQRSGYS